MFSQSFAIYKTKFHLISFIFNISFFSIIVFSGFMILFNLIPKITLYNSKAEIIYPRFIDERDLISLVKYLKLGTGKARTHFERPCTSCSLLA